MILQFGQSFKAAGESSGQTTKRKVDDTEMEEEEDEKDEEHMSVSLRHRRTKLGKRRRLTSHGIDNRHDLQPGLSAQSS